MEQPGLVLASLSDEEILKEIGLRLHWLRRNKRLGLIAVGEATGIGVSTLSRYENGRADKPSLPKMLRLAEFYDVSPDWLFGDLGRMRVFPKGDPLRLEMLEGEGKRERGVIAGQSPLPFLGPATVDAAS